MTLQLKDLPACPEGMNQQTTPWEIPDSQARWLEDFLLHRENEMTRRGPIIPKTGWPTSISEKGIGLVATDDPSYQWRVAVLHGTAAASKMSILNTSYTSVNSITWATGEGVFFDPSKRYKVATTGHLRGGAIIGVQNFQGAKGQTSIGHWGGGSKDSYSTGTVKSTNQDSTSVTGVGTSWLANVEAGMFLFAVIDEATGAGKNYIGQVKSVESDTALTLVDGALHAVTNGGTGRAYTIKSVRPLERRVAKGTVTVASGVKIVNGALTKFKRQMNEASATDKWIMFRADDMKFIGVVDTIASDIQLTLASNTTFACNKDEYVAINVKGDRTLKTVDHNDFGWISASYAGRQWYANNPYSNKSQPFSASRVWFSDIFDPEALDHTADGDHILIPSTKPPIRPITAMIGLPSCLAVFKENEVYAIYGTDESNFSLKKVDVEDGALSPMVLQQYADGVIFAGAHGIWFFDGQQCFNLCEDRMEDWYQKAMEGARARTYGAWSMLYKDTYFLYSDKATPPTGPDRTNNTTNAENGTAADHLALAIRLDRRAFTTLTNFSFQGSVRSPNEESQGTIYLANKLGDSSPFTLAGARFCSASDLFYTEGVDTITTDLVVPFTNQLGPNAFWESKRYDIGQPELKKRFKQLQMQYRLDSISGNYVAYGLEDANVGNTSIGTAVDMPVDFKVASKFTLSGAGEVTALKFYMDGLGSGSGPQVLKAFIYSDSAGPSALLAISTEVTIADGQAAGYVTFPLTATESLAAGDYWIGVHAGGNTNSSRIYRMASGSNYDYATDTYVGGTSDPFGAIGGTVSSEINGYMVASVGTYDYNNNYLTFATMVGFNELSVTSGGKWRLTRAVNSSGAWKAAFQNKRLKFNKRSTHVGFKVQQSNKTGIKALRIGPSALAYKEMRPGRV